MDKCGNCMRLSECTYEFGAKADDPSCTGFLEPLRTPHPEGPTMTDMTEAMLADGWIKHDGGPCPVHPHAKIGVIIRGFNRNHLCQLPGGSDEAGNFEWQHNSSTPAADIIAYKLEQQQ